MMNDSDMLRIAIEEARLGLEEGGIPIGAALFDGEGNLLGRGHNRRVQEDDPSIHGETDAFRKAGRQRNYPAEGNGQRHLPRAGIAAALYGSSASAR